MTRLAILAAVLLAGCVASPEDAETAPEIIGQAGRCIQLYERRETWEPADSGATCPSGRVAESVGSVRKQVGKAREESFALVEYRTIWGCRKIDNSKGKL